MDARVKPATIVGINQLLTTAILAPCVINTGDSTNANVLAASHPRAGIRDVECGGPRPRARRAALARGRARNSGENDHGSPCATGGNGQDSPPEAASHEHPATAEESGQSELKLVSPAMQPSGARSQVRWKFLHDARPIRSRVCYCLGIPARSMRARHLAMSRASRAVSSSGVLACASMPTSA
jgi:hypothetical protein